MYSKTSADDLTKGLGRLDMRMSQTVDLGAQRLSSPVFSPRSPQLLFIALPDHVKVLFVDTASKLERAVNHILSMNLSEPIIGAFDLEFMRYSAEILQFAVSVNASTVNSADFVLVLDLPALDCTMEEFDFQFMRLLERCSHCFGFSLSNDIRLLELHYPHYTIWEVLRNISKDLCTHQSLSLTKLSSRWLGRPVDKELRSANWSKRPLSKAMLYYAALDAWVLLEIDRAQARSADGKPPFPTSNLTFATFSNERRFVEATSKGSKAWLFEFAQARGDPDPTFTTTSVSGPPHQVRAEFNGRFCDGVGWKVKDAENDAAEKILAGFDQAARGVNQE
jgi:hypothetical protein